jgi:hypothetical protein
MMYNPMTGRPQSDISVVLSSQEVARQAVKAVDGAPLFNQKIEVQPYFIDGFQIWLVNYRRSGYEEYESP